MLFRAGKSVTEQHREMIYALTRQINAQQCLFALASRALLDVIEARDTETMLVKMPRLKQVLAEIAAAGGE